jgi:heptosyltransferase-2
MSMSKNGSKTAYLKLSVLIIKLGATGDVVRTTPLLRRIDGPVSWITTENNLALLERIDREVRCVSWENRKCVADITYDLVINLEDDRESSSFLKELKFKQLFGAHLNEDGKLAYTSDSRSWFDLSLISTYGRKEADRLKLLNRRTYQELVFEGLGLGFQDETYYLPPSQPTGLKGDVAISATAGPVWPMKQWAYYDELKNELETAGLKVNILEKRSSLLEHLADVQGHRCLVSGDSLPMHLALGSGLQCVSIFTCTSPWEIHGYGLQAKIVSPLLERFFYKRGYDRRATNAISVEKVMDAVMAQFRRFGDQRTSSVSMVKGNPLALSCES